ncbi:MAG TPA: class I SAM-dependent methyltransferase [Candidatus Corynebacterium avicola]|uniref:Class I SAM-dependent methyltransferase n=1 Tax=Candidatus Corynebacterium avicola TaxID=2838527 RepID=A0A9D1RTH8_9CORY|nr:class I SAM-dependent methyltransferase [Candidatus Corynebacterium avicola]
MTGTRYTHGHGEAVLGTHSTRTAEDSVGFVLPHLHRDSRVLDVGCGPGSITVDLAALVAGFGGSASQVTGVENTEVPLTSARELAAARGVGATFQTGDAYALPFTDSSFDIVLAHQVLQHLDDPVAALREFARVCAPGGLVAVRDADYAGMHFHPETEGMRLWQSNYRQRARDNGGEPDGGRHLVRWALEAGFRPGQISVGTSTWTYCTGRTDGTGHAGRPTWLAESWIRRTRDAADGIADADVEAICRGWQQWAEDPAAVFVMPHGELLVRI